jgi:hypothetical protein
MYVGSVARIVPHSTSACAKQLAPPASDTRVNYRHISHSDTCPSFVRFIRIIIGEPFNVFLDLLPNTDRLAASSRPTSRDTDSAEAGLIRTRVYWSLGYFLYRIFLYNCYMHRGILVTNWGKTQAGWADVLLVS